MATNNLTRNHLDPWISTSSMVDLQCGTSSPQTTYHVHEELLRRHSRHCESILSHTDTVDAVFSRVIQIPHEAEVVEVYIRSLYTSALLRTLAPPLDWFGEIGGINTLAKIYLLAEYLEDTATKNAIMKVLVQKSNSCVDIFPATSLPSAFRVAGLYAAAKADSPLRHFLVNLIVGNAARSWFKPATDVDFPNEFLLQLGEELVDRRSEIEGCDMDSTKYLEMEDCESQGLNDTKLFDATPSPP